MPSIRSRVLVRRSRRRSKALPRLRAPSHAAYLADLLEWTAPIKRAIRGVLPELRAFEAQRQDAIDIDTVRARVKRAFDAIRTTAGELSQGAGKIASRFVVEAERSNRKRMNAQFKGLATVDVFQPSSALRPLAVSAAQRNVRLISSIPSDLLDDAESTIREHLARGSRVESLAADLEERFSVSDSRAEFIARDQTLKFNGALARGRHEELGIRRYTWSTSQDERVRGRPGGPKTSSDHYHLNGKEFTYDDPPIVDTDPERRCNPGEDYQCRCVANPLVDDVLDALEENSSEDDNEA